MEAERQTNAVNNNVEYGCKYIERLQSLDLVDYTRLHRPLLPLLVYSII
jgi:hypothetical protein